MYSLLKYLRFRSCSSFKEFKQFSAVWNRFRLHILPSSVHEVMLLPAVPDTGEALDGLRDLVAGINRSDALSARDVLSDRVFYYNRRKRELTVAG